MEQAKQVFLFNLRQKAVQHHIPVKQGDTAFTLFAAFSDGDHSMYPIPKTGKVCLRGVTPAGKEIFNECNILEDNVVSHCFSPNLTAVPGEMECEFVFFGEENRQITGQKFIVEVEETAGDETQITQTAEFSALIQAMSQTLQEQQNAKALAQQYEQLIAVPPTQGPQGEKGEKGDKGDQGPQGLLGPQGVAGYTPQKGVDYFTPTEQSQMVQEVMDSLGGVPVFGVVDEENNIVLSGNLADGTYLLKYEHEDGSTTNIGEVTIGATMPTSGTVELVWSNGVKLDKTTGAEGVGEGYSATPLLELWEGYTYTAHRAADTYGGISICYYDANGGYLGYEELWNSNDRTQKDVAFTPKPNATHFRVRGYFGTNYITTGASVTFEKTA